MTKEERELRREQREHMKRMEAAAKEAGRGPIDVPFLLLVLLLTGVGLIMLLSASFPSAYYESGDPLYYFKRQAAFATLGLAAMVVIGRINYARFRGVAKIALGISIALLVAVIIPGVGITSHGATRWLGIPGTTMRFQPSEIAKLGVILYFADSISKKKDKMRTLRYGILPYGFILALIAVLMYFEPHLSGTVLILGIGAAMMFVGGIRGYWVGIGIGGVAAVAYAFLSGLITYNSSRIAIWLDPLNDAFKTGTGYQTRQSLIAIGSGGLLGLGLGKSRQKFLFLDRAPRARPLRQPSCRGHYHADRLTGFLKHRGRDESCAEHRHLAAVLQLRRHGARHPARGDGRGAECFTADAARLKSSKICRGGKQTAARKKGGRKA